MAEESHKVCLNVYDLSQGLARQMSMTFLGKAIEGIWHTGIIVYGNEYYYSGGIQQARAGTTHYGTPVRVVDLGVTHVPKEVFEMYLQEISPRYTAEAYSLLRHNCNNFSNEVAQFLVGVTIPDDILNLPNEVMNSPMGGFIMPMIQQLESSLRADVVPQAPQFILPTVAPASRSTVSTKTPSIPVNQSSNTKSEDTKPSSEVENVKAGEQNKNAVVPPVVKPSGEQQKQSTNAAALGDARSKVQEEIMREFAAIMATGTSHASEAAALAARRVMQRYGQTSAAQG